jgi:hypothetical protein
VGAPAAGSGGAPINAPEPLDPDASRASRERDPSAPGRLRRIVILINQPLLRASKQTRDLVGWIGLITLFNASVLFMGRTVFQITGHESAPSHAVASADGHGAKAADDHGGGHGEPKKDAHGAAAKKDDGHGAEAKKKEPAKKPAAKSSAKKPVAKKKDEGGHGGGH